MYLATTYNIQPCCAINKLVLAKLPVTLLKFQTKLFLTLLKVGISKQVPILMASKVIIKKCNDLDHLPIDTSNEIYRLKTEARKENYYLVIPKDCTIHVQMNENQKVSFRTIRKVNEQHVPKRTNTRTSQICCYILYKTR